jgi:hypothetical protein
MTELIPLTIAVFFGVSLALPGTTKSRVGMSSERIKFIPDSIGHCNSPEPIKIKMIPGSVNVIDSVQFWFTEISPMKSGEKQIAKGAALILMDKDTLTSETIKYAIKKSKMHYLEVRVVDQCPTCQLRTQETPVTISFYYRKGVSEIKSAFCF